MKMSEKILRAIKRGEEYNKIAKRLGVTRAWVSNVAVRAGIRKRAYRDRGVKFDVERARALEAEKKFGAAELDAMALSAGAREWLAARPRFTRAEIAAMLGVERETYYRLRREYDKDR